MEKLLFSVKTIKEILYNDNPKTPNENNKRSLFAQYMEKGKVNKAQGYINIGRIG